MNLDLKNSIDEVAAALRSSGARAVYIFGSASTSETRENADVDVAVSGLPPHLFFRALSKASRLLNRPLHLVDLDEATPFARYLREEGNLKRVG